MQLAISLNSLAIYYSDVVVVDLEGLFGGRLSEWVDVQSVHAVAVLSATQYLPSLGKYSGKGDENFPYSIPFSSLIVVVVLETNI